MANILHDPVLVSGKKLVCTTPRNKLAINIQIPLAITFLRQCAVTGLSRSTKREKSTKFDRIQGLVNSNICFFGKKKVK